MIAICKKKYYKYAKYKVNRSMIYNIVDRT